MLAQALSAATEGVSASVVEVEVDIASGMPKEQVVGLPDAAVKESLHRVRAALTNAGYSWPSNKRVTINLAPADSRKEGPLYDLPIALAFMAATGQMKAERLNDFLFVGELALDGRLRPIRGALLFALLARKMGKHGLMLPPENAQEAAVVEGIRVYAAPTLPDAAAMLNGNTELQPVHVDLQELFSRETPESALDLGDVRGQEHVKRAVTVAAGGGHNLLML